MHLGNRIVFLLRCYEMIHSLQIGAAEADLAIQAIRTELVNRNKAAVIAVGDAQGELISLLRMDGAMLPSVVVASNKVWTAARQRQPTGQVGADSRDEGWDFSFYGDSRYMGWPGGIPVMVDGRVVGAVAVSGLSGVEDEALATLGVEAILNGIMAEA
jgi:glc operon protein GlcG